MTQILVHIIIITVPLEGFVLCLLCKSAIERVCSVHCMQYAVMNTQYLGSLQTRRLRAVHVLQKYSLLSRFSVICIKVMMMHSMSRMEKVLTIVLCADLRGARGAARPLRRHHLLQLPRVLPAQSAEQHRRQVSTSARTVQR